LANRERNDILPEHNQGLCLIPQILTHSAEDFVPSRDLKYAGILDVFQMFQTEGLGQKIR
jgi:hypothetical protein